ncbi:tyrosine-type recombinase/integrase [bacterium]|jgi:integrase/recombinase XerC|nr:tyrosine-type recombinase/integrase [bacterium]MBT4122237.1 tyrosine-type recombinase/integrase [bacterium]
MDQNLTTHITKFTVLNNAQKEATKVFRNLDISKTTFEDYTSRIKLFLEFISDKPFTINIFLEYKHYLRDRNDFSVATKNKYLVVGRVFLKELNRLGHLPADITQNIKAFKQSKKHKKDGLNDEEINFLVSQLNLIPDNASNIRLKAFISLLIFQGLRQCEIVRLDIKDLDLANLCIYIKSKGSDDKELVYLHPITVKILKRYLKINKIADGPLFVSNSNNSKAKRLSVRGLRKIVTSLLRELNIDKNIHGFRHYFVTTLVKNYKGDLLEVARYTRHKSLEMLQVYNDNIKQKADLPRYYKSFNNIQFQ